MGSQPKVPGKPGMREVQRLKGVTGKPGGVVVRRQDPEEL